MPNPPELSGSLVDVVVVAVVDVAAACVPVSDRFPVVSCAAAAAATVDVENVAEAEAETGAETELDA